MGDVAASGRLHVCVAVALSKDRPWTCMPPSLTIRNSIAWAMILQLARSSSTRACAMGKDVTAGRWRW